jgi:hypothetical protein
MMIVFFKTTLIEIKNKRKEKKRKEKQRIIPMNNAL